MVGLSSFRAEQERGKEGQGHLSNDQGSIEEVAGVNRKYVTSVVAVSMRQRRTTWMIMPVVNDSRLFFD